MLGRAQVEQRGVSVPRTTHGVLEKVASSHSSEQGAQPMEMRALSLQPSLCKDSGCCKENKREGAIREIQSIWVGGSN